MASLNYSILVIDDDQDIRDFLARRLASEEYTLTAVGSGQEAVKRIKQERFDLILSDLLMPDMSGIELLEQIKKTGVDSPVILITAHGSLDTAVQAMRAGAYDYVQKPINLPELKLSIERALKFRQLERDNTALRTELKQSWRVQDIIGKSRGIKAVFDLVSRVAPTQANVLIQGESGTGKELVARALHAQSSRASGPFIAINCSAIPADLLESELFGHAKGSFTGAHQSKKGLFEEAHGGTVFLDEIGDMEQSLQAKLLRVLQERKIKPVGENKDRDIDVRILAATHKDLRAAIKEGRFREDLYYRLCVIPIEIPPLRQRKDDIPLLAEHFMQKHAATHGLSIKGFTPEGMAKLLQHTWEGNVRELENVIERSVILARGERVTDTDLPDFHDPKGNPVSELEERASEFHSLEEIEKYYIGLILRKTGGKKERAAQILGIDRKTLRRKEKDYGLAADSEETLPTGAESESHADVTH